MAPALIPLGLPTSVITTLVVPTGGFSSLQISARSRLPVLLASRHDCTNDSAWPLYVMPLTPFAPGGSSATDTSSIRLVTLATVTLVIVNEEVAVPVVVLVSTKVTTPHPPALPRTTVCAVLLFPGGPA